VRARHAVLATALRRKKLAWHRAVVGMTNSSARERLRRHHNTLRLLRALKLEPHEPLQLLHVPGIDSTCVAIRVPRIGAGDVDSIAVRICDAVAVEAPAAAASIGATTANRK